MHRAEFLLPRTRATFRSPAALPADTVHRWLVKPAPGLIIRLSLPCQLSAGIAEAVVGAVCRRVWAASPPAYAVILDLGATRELDEGTRSGLRRLHRVLAEAQVDLRLALPESDARTALASDGTPDALPQDAVYATVRSASLAALAEIPGPALVSSAVRGLLRQPPEMLRLP